MEAELSILLREARKNLDHLDELRTDVLASRKLQSAGYQEAVTIEQQALTEAAKLAEEVSGCYLEIAKLFERGDV